MMTCERILSRVEWTETLVNGSGGRGFESWLGQPVARNPCRPRSQLSSKWVPLTNWGRIYSERREMDSAFHIAVVPKTQRAANPHFPYGQ